MIKRSILWLKNNYQKVIDSIAFYPVFIAFLFLIGSTLLISFDFSEMGMKLKAHFKWLNLEDASTVRSIVSAIAGGVISLTVFSFSMVMVVLNQAASQMSNRVLDKLIGNRFQQVVLGVYIGTIVYAFFLLSMVSDFKDQNDIPSLSTFALIGLVIFDIFLFIYFLHYITQSVKYEVIIKRIFEVTKTQLKGLCEGKYADVENCEQTQKFTIKCNSSGVFQGLDEDETLKILDKYDCNMYFIHRSGTFLIKNQPVAYITKDLCEEEIQEISSHIYLHTSESINYNPYFGLQQLTEVAVKALSPGVNDPGTAIISLRSLLILLAYLLEHKPGNGIKDANDQTRIICQVLTFEEAFNEFLLPIWDYGKTDRLVQYEFRRVLKQFYSIKENKTLELFMETIQEQMESQKTDLTAD